MPCVLTHVRLQDPTREVFLTSECSAEAVDAIDQRVDDIMFFQPPHAPAQQFQQEGALLYCCYEYDTDAEVFVPLRSCFVFDRLPTLPQSLSSRCTWHPHWVDLRLYCSPETLAIFTSCLSLSLSAFQRTCFLVMYWNTCNLC